MIPKQTSNKNWELEASNWKAADTGVMNFLPSMETAPLTQSAQGIGEGVVHIVEPVNDRSNLSCIWHMSRVKRAHEKPLFS